MRFSKSLALLALPILAVATPNPFPGGEKPTTTTKVVTSTVTITATATSTPVDQCSTGSIQCCNSVQSASDPSVTSLLGLLGIVIDGVDALVGLTCSPLSILGIGGGECNSNVVCCQDNSIGGLISIGCIPIIL